MAGGEVNRAVGVTYSKFQTSYHFIHKYFSVPKRYGMGLLFKNKQASYDHNTITQFKKLYRRVLKPDNSKDEKEVFTKVSSGSFE